MESFEYLGPYRIGELLGRGGMGSVFAAKHAKSGDEVAVKVIASQYADDMRFRRRFVKEIESLMLLRHENIVRILGTGEEQDHLFYSMELFEGETLQQLIRRHKRLDWETTLDISVQIASALKHAHDVGVRHRDLKPANIFLVNGTTVKIVDFGIGQVLLQDWRGKEKLKQAFDPDDEMMRGFDTVPGSILGTADYMAPEQAGDGPITNQTDLYALGSLMYAMLVGRPPFTGKGVTEVIHSLKNERPIPLQMVNPEIPTEITELVSELLEKDPNDRPPTTLAVLNRLKAIRGGLKKQATLASESMPARSTGTGATGDTKVREVPVVSSDGGTVGDAGTGANEVTGIHSSVTNELADDATNRRRPPTAVSLHSTPGLDQPQPAGSQTVDSHAAQDGAPGSEYDIDLSDVAPRSHFQTVDRDVLEDDLLSRDDDRGYWWVQALSIAGMVAILIVGAVLFAGAMRTPDADLLYGKIETAEAEDDLLTVESTMRLFVENYPGDERASEVVALQTKLESERFLRRMKHRAGNEGGIELLPPAELAFYEAMQQREVDPQDASNRLQAWLDVFAVGNKNPDRNMQLMTIAATEESERLQSVLASLGPDKRLLDLQQRLSFAETSLAPAEQQKLLQGIVSLYESKLWAAPAVQRALERLDELDSLP